MNKNIENHLSKQGYPVTWCASKSQFKAALLNLRQNLEATSTSNDEVENTQIDFMAALYGLHFKIKPLTLNTALQNSNHAKQLIWIEQSETMTTDEFDTALHKITQYFEIDPFCIIRIDNEQAEVSINHQQQQIHDEIPTDQITQYLQERFYSLYIPLAGQPYHIEIDTEYTHVLEPQTNLGKMARDLRVKSILEKMK